MNILKKYVAYRRQRKANYKVEVEKLAEMLRTRNLDIRGLNAGTVAIAREFSVSERRVTLDLRNAF